MSLGRRLPPAPANGWSGGPAMVSPKPPIPIPHPSGLPPGSHPVPPCRVRVWALTHKQSSASPTRLRPPHVAASKGAQGNPAPHGHNVGWGAVQCRSRGRSVEATCSARLGYVELPPLQPHSRVLHRGRSTPQSPPAWGFVPGPSPHPFPPSTPGLALSHTPNPSMFKDNFPNGCFYFIACNKDKRPKVLGSALH